MIALYNVVGEKIRTITLQHGQTKAEINACDLREGIYFYAILKEGVVIGTRKIGKKQIRLTYNTIYFRGLTF